MSIIKKYKKIIKKRDSLLNKKIEVEMLLDGEINSRKNIRSLNSTFNNEVYNDPNRPTKHDEQVFKNLKESMEYSNTTRTERISNLLGKSKKLKTEIKKIGVELSIICNP